MNKVDRGFVDLSMISKQRLSREKCYLQLKDENASNRTIAAFQFRSYLDKEIAIFLLKHLLYEDKLYVRIALCDTLSQGDEEVAKIMVTYLGKIGHNQIHELPLAPSKKKSYPLARDLVARAMARMPASMLVSLFLCTERMEVLVLREFLDALGFSLFYNQLEKSLMKQVFEKLMDSMDTYKDDIVTWKCIQCASALPASMEWLELMKSSETEVFCKEAKRSIALLKLRL